MPANYRQLLKSIDDRSPPTYSQKVFSP